MIVAAFADVAAVEPSAAAAVVRHEPYLTNGFTYYGSDRRLAVGIGAGAGYRFHLTRSLWVFAEARWGGFLGNFAAGAAGMMYTLRLGPLNPAAGLQALAVAGDEIAVLSAEHPDRPPPLAFAGQLRLAPLRFLHEPFSVVALGLEAGFGSDDGTRALAFGLSILEIGIRF